MEQQSINIFISLVAVVFVFLFAVKKFSNQMQYLIGDRFKNLLEKSTSTPLRGALVGFGITSIIQSSSAVTVLLVSLVDAGVLSFVNSVGVIIGANVGTTITTQLVAFKILNIAPYILIFGFLLMNIKNRYQHFGKPVFYFGLIFSCLFIVSVLSVTLQENELFISLIENISNVFWAILVGVVWSTVLQSSSLATSLVVVLTAGGLLNFSQAFGIILGTNIGTTTTALIASTVTGRQGRKVAMAHFLFNVLGVFIFLPFVNMFSKFVTSLNLDVAGQVALSHLFFNCIIAILFLIFIKPFINLIHRIV